GVGERQEVVSASIGDVLRIGFRRRSLWPAPLAVLIRGSSPAGRTNRKEIFRPDPLGWRRFPGVIRLRISSDRLLRRFPWPGPERRCPRSRNVATFETALWTAFGCKPHQSRLR